MNCAIRVIVCAIAALTTGPATQTALAQDVQNGTARMRVDGTNGSASPSNYGDDWEEDAYLYPQDAIADAEILIDQQIGGTERAEIWVAAGTYYPDEDASTGDGGDDDETRSFNLLDNVELLGGFAGGPNGETNRNQRNPAANITILSGDIDEDDVGQEMDNSRHVVFAIDVGPTAILNGFTIRDGSGYLTEGAGIHLEDSGAVVINCRITENLDIFGGHGAGMWIEGTRDDVGPRIVNCRIDNNYTFGNGGGVWAGSNIVMANCLIDNNEAFGTAGGLFAEHTELDIMNCTIADNEATYGDGKGIYFYGALTMYNCILWGNGDGSERQQIGPCEEEEPQPCDPCECIDTNLTRIYWTCIQNLNLYDFTEQNNIGDDPEFVDASNGDYRLEESSPAINAGEDSFAHTDAFDVDEDGNTSEPTGDLDITVRIVANDVDMGAFEFQCLGDADADGDVDFDDFTLLLANYGACTNPCQWDCPTDLDGDCDTDFDDFTLLLANFGACDITGVGVEDTLWELFQAAGLDGDDYDDYLDILENGTQQQQDCWNAWLDHYITCSPQCQGTHGCSDPFASN